jgi:hypothetical protein
MRSCLLWQSRLFPLSLHDKDRLQTEPRREFLILNSCNS